MTTRMNVLLSILAVTLLHCVLFPASAPLTEQEEARIAKELASKVEWSGYGNIVTAKIPIIEIPKNDPIFRIVRVFTSGEEKNGYHFEGESLGIDFGRPRRIDVGKMIQEAHHRK